ncbi:MAG: hypothetical protein IKD31_03585 [Clostridia bacterium]|nr:hypothetical protein [Clostridia bacterium]
MKQNFSRCLVIALFLILLIFGATGRIALSLPDASFDFFSRLVRSQRVREVFGLEEEEAIVIFGDLSEEEFFL